MMFYATAIYSVDDDDVKKKWQTTDDSSSKSVKLFVYMYIKIAVLVTCNIYNIIAFEISQSTYDQKKKIFLL